MQAERACRGEEVKHQDTRCQLTFSKHSVAWFPLTYQTKLTNAGSGMSSVEILQAKTEIIVRAKGSWTPGAILMEESLDS